MRLTPFLVSEQGSFPQRTQCFMPITHSGSSYNMENNQNPNTDLPHLQAQITELTSVLEEINQRYTMEEHRTRDEFGPHNRRVHRPPPDNEVDRNEENEEDEEYGVRNRGFGDHEACFRRNGHEFPRGRGERTSTVTLLMN